MVIHRVAPLSAAKIAGVLYLIVGFCAGALFSLVALAGTFIPDGAQDVFPGAIFGVGAIIILPIVYGGMGFVTTLIMAWIYNMVAAMVGGIEVDIR